MLRSKIYDLDLTKKYQLRNQLSTNEISPDRFDTYVRRKKKNHKLFPVSPKDKPRLEIGLKKTEARVIPHILNAIFKPGDNTDHIS
jgi:hypothetical protein